LRKSAHFSTKSSLNPSLYTPQQQIASDFSGFELEAGIIPVTAISHSARLIERVLQGRLVLPDDDWLENNRNACH
jgi:hypothetical protein